ncbi:MAG: hypothetical protein R3B46_13420 [Phycisphaerales bacterium]|nr:hypothetical protein [Phycisphaerales bacterium]
MPPIRKGRRFSFEDRLRRADGRVMLTFAFWLSLGASMVVVLLTALGIQLASGVGLYAKKRGERLSKQPWVDVYVMVMLLAPWVGCAIVAGWWGLLGSFGGQAVAAAAWSVMHIYSHPKRDRGRGPTRALGKRVGRTRVWCAMGLSVVMLPMLVAMRVMQMTVWPLFRRLMRLPAENGAVYFSFTRHGATGLVGVELLWALYCEWAMGVWSMSGQIVRHCASMWCPMRFAEESKNRAFSVDFPDVERWGEANSLSGTERVIDQMYGGGSTAWFGHASRDTGVAESGVRDEASKQAA